MSLEHISSLDVRAARLDRLRKAAFAATTSVAQELGPFERIPTSDEAFLRALAVVDLGDDDAGLSKTDRVSRYFSEFIEAEVDGMAGTRPHRGFSERFGFLLRQAIVSDAAQLEALVKAGLKDPIALKSDNVVALGMSEGSSEYVSGPLDDGHVAWMSEDALGPKVLNKWRRALRKSYEDSATLRRTTGH